MKKVLIFLLSLGLILTLGCTKADNIGDRDEDNLIPLSEANSSIDKTISDTSQSSITTDESSDNSFFFKDNISQLTYKGKILFDEPVQKEIDLHIREVSELKEGKLYELKLDSFEGIPDDRLNLGYFYVQKDQIYRINPTEDNLKKLKSTGEMPDDCVIVCQNEEIKDSLGSDERGFHKYIEVNGEKREYHSYNNQVDTGYYEAFTWERNKGLTFYKSGFGAERDAIELQLKTDSKTADFNIPENLKYYVKKNSPEENNDSIIFYSAEDIDSDGRIESIIATGVVGEDPSSSGVSQIYILRENDGQIERIDKEDFWGGYGIYEIKLIQLQNMPGKYIYCGLTNGAHLLGFEIVRLINNKLEVICYSASPTGAGEDSIKDFNNDGKFDGYVQNRWSYDVLYFPLESTYVLKDTEFVLDSQYAELPDYPDNIKEVILQYLSLRVIDAEKSLEVKKRLSELCKYPEDQEEDFSPDIWYEPVFNSLIIMERGLSFNIKENKNAADAVISFSDEDKKAHKKIFHLVKTDNRWCIDKIK